MTHSNHPNGNFAVTSQALAGLVLTTLALVLAPGAGGAATSLDLGVQDLNGGYESNRTAFLTWTAEADRVYRVQSSTNLSNAAAWKTEDAVIRSGVGPVKWMAPEALQERKYYRLVLPPKGIEAVEPAVITPGAAVDFYIVGQDFGPADVLRINGEPQDSVFFNSPSLLSRPGFTPSAPGTYHFELVAAGQVLSSFDVLCADPASSPELVLQGPSAEPPASPMFAACLSKKGYDYYKAQSDLTAAGLQSNPAYQDNSNTGQMPDALLAAFLSKRGYDYYQAQSQRTFDIQEGKKGLNAVNVKLARVAGAAVAGGISGGVVAAVNKGGGASVGKAKAEGMVMAACRARRITWAT